MSFESDGRMFCFKSMKCVFDKINKNALCSNMCVFLKMECMYKNVMSSTFVHNFQDNKRDYLCFKDFIWCGTKLRSGLTLSLDGPI